MNKKDGNPGELSIRLGSNFTMLSKKIAELPVDSMTAEEIYTEANRIAVEANESVHRSLAVVDKTVSIGGDTLTQLRSQSDQIDRMQDDLDRVNNNLHQADRKARSIDSVWGTAANKITSPLDGGSSRKAAVDRQFVEDRRKEERAIQRQKVAEWENQKETDKEHNKFRDDSMARQSQSIQPDEHDTEESKFYFTVADTDRTLDDIRGGLTSLKGIAKDMNDELREQNGKLEELQREVSAAQPRLNRTIDRTTALVKK